MMFKNSRVLVLAASLCFASATTVHAAPITFTDRAAFDVAIAGLNVGVQDFEGEADGTLIPDGGALGGITFSYPTLAGLGVSLMVSGALVGTSGTNTLGTNDADLFQDSDDFDMSFAAANAVGLFVISIDPLIDGDFEFSAGGATASLATADLQQTLSDGSAVYFLGVVDTVDTFTQASLTTSHTPGNFFTWNADDIVIARAEVSEPASLALLGLGIGLAGLVRRRRARV